MIKNYCEFIGTKKYEYDGIKKGHCKFVGFSHCQKYKKPHEYDFEGWTICLDECKIPYHRKRVKK